jgi:K+-transporting ATPase ATPase C chain
MKVHLRACLRLLLLTVAICCVLYPAVLWLFAHAFFPANAAGSLIVDKGPDGKEVVKGSRLIGQKFTKDWYFQPRPSAADYNSTASGGSNYGSSNPKLRDRVARQLGPMIRYNPDGPKKDESVQKDIEKWFAEYVPDEGSSTLVVQWAKAYPTLAANWVKGDAKPAVIEWLRAHPEILDKWRKEKKDAPAVDLDDDKTVPFDDIAVGFFESVAAAPGYKNRWPEAEEYETGEKDDKGEPVKKKRFKAVAGGADFQATFFDLWLAAHPKADLRRVPADMVMASGSGLDPDITLRNALSIYQLDRVAAARAEKLGRDPAKVKERIEQIVRARQFTPLSGLLGEPLVNVLEVNLELDKEYPLPPEPAKTP